MLVSCKRTHWGECVQRIEFQRRSQIKTAADPKKILFVTPPYHSGVDEIAGRWVPLGLVYLAAAARLAHVHAEIYDALAKGDDYPAIERHLLDAQADYVACSAMTATVYDAVKILELAKQVRPDSVTILGGIHPTFMYEELLTGSAAVDYVVVGEGEQTIRQLLEVLEEGGNPEQVAGLAFRHGGGVTVTGKRPLMENLDDLPAAWDLLDWSDYYNLAIPDSRLGSISTSRGCDRECSFCSQRLFWDKSWRARNPQKIADELEYLYQTHGVNVFMITDEYPTRDGERWNALLDAVIAKDLPVHVLMETRAADILRDRDIIWKYRKAGIIYISLGIESADQSTLDALNKDMQLNEISEVFTILRTHQIVSEASFMMGFPGESPESIKKTMQLAQQFNPDIANFFTFTPWPYSEGYGDMKPLLRENDYRKYNMVDPVLEPRKMTLLQIDVAVADCYRRFYMSKIIEFMTMEASFTRDYLMRITKLFMGSSFVMKKLSVGIMGMIPSKIDEIKMKFRK